MRKAQIDKNSGCDDGEFILLAETPTLHHLWQKVDLKLRKKGVDSRHTPYDYVIIIRWNQDGDEGVHFDLR